jgi:hypothetical protein
MTFWALAFVFVLLLLGGKVLYSLNARKSTRCPDCGAPTRHMEPYYMCDSCENLVGVRIGKTNYF